MNVFKKITFIFIILTFSTNNLISEVPHYLDFRYILNQSEAGKKAQATLKKKLTDGINKIESKEAKLQEDEKKIIQQKKLVSAEDYRKKVSGVAECGRIHSPPPLPLPYSELVRQPPDTYYAPAKYDYGDAPDWLPLDEVTRVQRAEPHGLDPTHDHDDEVPVRRHGVWAGRGRPGGVGRSRVVIAVCTPSGPKCNMRGKLARIVFGPRGELAGPLPSKALRGTLTMRSLPALLTLSNKTSVASFPPLR